MYFLWTIIVNLLFIVLPRFRIGIDWRRGVVKTDAEIDRVSKLSGFN